MADFADYAWLINDESAAAQLARLADDPRPTLQTLNALRRELPPERARLVVEQVELRRRAVAKFDDRAARMFFAPTLLEQATDRWIAAYKASRLAAAAPRATIHDACCGLGGDLMALARVGPCIGWDLSQVACLLAEANLRVVDREIAGEASVRLADVEQLSPAADELWHIDPDRRAGGKRTTAVERYLPGPALIDRWLTTGPSGAVKLAPASDVPSHWQSQASLEWITNNRECRQLVVWFGRLATAPGNRRATIVAACGDRAKPQAAGTFEGTANVPCEASRQPLRYVYDPDPSLLAAGLLGDFAACHGLKSLGAGGVYLTGDSALADAMVQGFEVQECLPLRAAEVAQHLAARGVGQVEIKKRGAPIDPNEFRRKLKLHGDGAATVILTRVGKRQLAIIAERLPPIMGLNETCDGD